MARSMLPLFEFPFKIGFHHDTQRVHDYDYDYEITCIYWNPTFFSSKSELRFSYTKEWEIAKSFVFFLIQLTET